MNEYDENVLLLKRNVSALVVALEHTEKLRQLDAKKIDGLLNTVAQLNTQVQLLTTQLAILRATALGNSATYIE